MKILEAPDHRSGASSVWGRRSGSRWGWGIAVLAAMLLPVDARSAEGLYLSWGDCDLAGAGAHDQIDSCLVNSGQNTLYCAFRMPQAASDVLGIEAVVDVQHSDLTLPDWWQFQSGGCRSGYLSTSMTFTGQSTCVDPWMGDGTSVLAGFDIGQPRMQPNQVRIKGTATVPSDTPRALDATDLYYGLTFVISNARSTGFFSCGGCQEGACLVLNSILVRRIPGAPGGDFFIQTPGAPMSNWATWNGGTGADCTAVPVRNVTWGRVKMLYR